MTYFPIAQFFCVLASDESYKYVHLYASPNKTGFKKSLRNVLRVVKGGQRRFGSSVEFIPSFLSRGVGRKAFRYCEHFVSKLSFVPIEDPKQKLQDGALDGFVCARGGQSGQAFGLEIFPPSRD
jgi:hypothetical protein